MPWIFDISVPITAGNSLWRYPGILEVKLAGVIEGECGGLTLAYDGIPDVSPERLGAVKDGKNLLTEVSSDAELMATNGSFWYNQSAGFVRLNLAEYSDGVAVAGFRPPVGKRISFGIIKGYCDAVDYLRDDKSTYEGTFYEPRLKAVPNASAKMDSLDYGIQAFNDLSLQLIGVDGEFEGVDYTAAIAKGFYTEPGEEKADAKKTAYGYVSKIQEGDETTLTIGDLRWLLNKNAKCGTLTKAQFPYLADDAVGKMIPIYWNKQTKVQPICLNADEDLSDSYSDVFRYCIGATPDSVHTIKRVDRVYASGSEGSMEIAPGYSFGSPIQTGLRRVDKLMPTLYVCANPRTVIAANWSFETAVATGISAADMVSVTGSENGVLTSGTDYTLSGSNIYLHDSDTITTQTQTITIDAKTVDLEAGKDFTVSIDGDGYALITLISGGTISANTYAITVSASSDDNDGKDIESPVSAWTATLYDPALKMAYISIPASVALADGDAPMDILVDLFGWSNTREDEAEWINGADIIRDALDLFAGYSYGPDRFDIQSWEIERVKCVNAGLHLSPRIEDDTTINDFIGKVEKSSLSLFTCRQDGLFDLKVDSKDLYPQWRIESYQRLEVGGESIDITSAFSTVTINYGTAGDSESSAYLDSTYKEQLEIANCVEATKTIDTILADEQSAKIYAAMVYDRTFNLDTFKPRARIEIKVPVEKYLMDIWPTKAFIAPRTRSGDLYAAYAVESVTRSESDNMITIVGRKRYDIEYDTEYTQGVLCDDFICDGQLIGATTIDAA